MKKSINPFKMVGSYIGMLLPVILILIMVMALNVKSFQMLAPFISTSLLVIGMPLFFPVGIILSSYLHIGEGALVLGIILAPICAIICGFLIGWAIHLLIRKLRRR